MIQIQDIGVPKNVEEISPVWISQILETKISSEDFILQTDIQRGSGFLSQMSRLNCKSEDGSKSFALVIKLLPDDEALRNLVSSEQFDRTEILFYDKVMPALIKLVPELKPYLCRSYFGRVEPENKTLGHSYCSVLVMEDLKPLGYYSETFGGQANSKQMEEVVEFMGILHFAGMALEDEKGQNLDTVYDFFNGASNSNKSSGYSEMAKAGFPEAIKLLKEHGTSDEIIDSLMKLSPHSDAIISRIEEASKHHPCLIHGDLWPNNLLFNTNPMLPPKVIDWQNLGYKNPAIDLVVAILPGLSVEDLNSKDGRILELLNIYWETFASQCRKAGKEHLIKYDFEAFKTYFYTWGMSHMLYWCLIATECFSSNYPRIVKVYELILSIVDVPSFLMGEINKQQ